LKEALFEAYIRERDQLDFCIPKKTPAGKPYKGPLPKGLEQFVESNLFIDLAQNILDYTFYLIRLEDRKRQLEIDARKKNIPAPKVLRAELDIL
jgi:hypothetical protein